MSKKMHKYIKDEKEAIKQQSMQYFDMSNVNFKNCIQVWGALYAGI